MKDSTYKAYRPVRMPYLPDAERFQADYETRLSAYMREQYIEIICYVRYFKEEKSPRARAIADAISAQTKGDE